MPRRKPTDRWYLADLVMETTVAGDRRRVVQVNTTLVRADSPQAALAAAKLLGRQSQHRYLNTTGRAVHVRFRGIRDLLEIYEPLEHGAELMYTEAVTTSVTAAARLARKKNQLGAFRPRTPKGRAVPNYMPADIADKLRRAGFSDAVDEATGKQPRPRGK